METFWVLILFWSAGYSPTVVIEKYETQAECDAVLSVFKETLKETGYDGIYDPSDDGDSVFKCVEAGRK